MSDDLYDVAVVGAGPAGASAAILLARKGLRVALLDRARFPREATYTGWLNAKAVPLLADLDVKTKPWLRDAFQDVTFYNSDFSKSAKPTLHEPPGYLVDQAAFNNALVASTSHCEVTLFAGQDVRDVRLNELSVSVRTGEETVAARLLLLAAGRATPLLARVGLVPETGPPPVWTAQVQADLPKKSRKDTPRMAVVFGLDKSESFATLSMSAKSFSITLHWRQDRADALSTLAGLGRTAYEKEVVPVDLSAEAASAKLVPSPASVALDMDSHVGKHTLVIGDAGGFVGAAGNEGLYPAMWSARIAAEVVEAALQSVHSQDELMTFNTKWRLEMADYLRAPNTDSQFLLPLVFSNQAMADRMAAAFFSGINI